jgi:hypothetical protein
MVNITKAQLERENQELRDHVAELEARNKSPRRVHSNPDIYGRRESVRLHSATPSTLLRNYPPTASASPPPPSPTTSSHTLLLPIVAPVPRDLKIDSPPEFTGKTAEYDSFIGQCEFYFMNKPVTFGGNDVNKVNFVISRLRGNPSRWAHAVIRTNPLDPTLGSWPLFRGQLDSLYSDPLRMEQVRRDLEALKQTGSASAFAAEFKTLAAIRNLDVDEKIFQYKGKLKGTVQTALAGLLAPGESFDSIVYKSIVVDQTLFEVDKATKKAAKSQNPPSSQQSPRPPQQQSRNPSNPSGSRNPSFSNSAPRNSVPSSSRSPSSSTPHPPLSDAEKQYREDNNLCRFCGGNHFKKDCEELKKKLEREAKKGLPPRYPTPSSSHVNAPVTVSHIISPAGKFDPQGH